MNSDILRPIINKTYLSMKEKRKRIHKRVLSKHEESEYGMCHKCSKTFKKVHLKIPQWYQKGTTTQCCPTCYERVLEKHNMKATVSCTVCGAYKKYKELVEVEWKPGHGKVCGDCYVTLYNLHNGE